MKEFISSVTRFVREEDAPTMMEYGLLIMLIAILAISGVSLLGQGVVKLFKPL